MSLEELIAQADERGLAASGLACSDRCVSLLVDDDELLRPLWAHLVDGSDWSGSLEKVRAVLGAVEPAAGENEAAWVARGMLLSAPDGRDREALREWAEACSAASLRVHRLLGPAGAEGVDEELPLVAAELGRQTVVLQLLAEHGPQGLRRALDVSGEGRRVLRAVVSRRARAQG
ncbi:hypothetical protein ACFWN1_10760 [Streptomyces sp. NPDC058459]|uniref:hypothetical protein n=1 Tax=Streptomyces sp. NPDC058459 TaxID=3346508 RepID=UPI003652F437